jgi:hypothetical protein
LVEFLTFVVVVVVLVVVVLVVVVVVGLAAWQAPRPPCTDFSTPLPKSWARLFGELMWASAAEKSAVEESGKLLLGTDI